MSKRWRRTASLHGASAAPPPSGPQVVSVVADVLDGTYTVTFDQTVIWNGTDTGTFEVNGETGGWQSQIDAQTLEFQTASQTAAPALPWDWASEDDSLTPVPDPSQTGTTS